MKQNTDSSPAAHTALRNELVLLEIFKHLTTKTLFCCSLVNKHWKNQVRTYMRDHRKCTIVIQLDSGSCAANHRQMIRKLNEDFGRVEVVPYNSVNIVVEPHRHGPETRQRCSRNSESQPEDLENIKVQWKDLFAKIHLKFLSISWNKEVLDCPATSVIYLLLLEKANEIKSLEFFQVPRSFDENLRGHQKKQKLKFPKLEELKISERFRYWAGRKDLLMEILDGSPKLKKIIHDGFFWILRMIPENKYKLLEKLTLMDYKDEMDSSAPFENVSSFGLHCSGNYGGFVNAYSRAKFGWLFPKLATVEINWDGPVMVRFREPTEFNDELEDTAAVLWESDSPRTSKTASKLILRNKACHVCYGGLKHRFPELTELQLFPDCFYAHDILYMNIFRFWPNLKKLVLSGQFSNRNANVDQVFCGVHQEELELLWKYGEKHLRKLHIVPVRPCLPTLTRKRKIK